MLLYMSLLDRLRNQHETIEQVIAKTDKSRITFHPEVGKWSIHDNIAHLAKYQSVFMERVQAILKADSPTFEPYRAETDPDFESWRYRTLTELIKTLKADRETVVKLITELPEQQLQRGGIHKKFGKLTIIQWTEFFLLHEAHHIFTVFRLANDVDMHSSHK